ncbi:transcription factor RFX4-like [Ruditapes philippinarum]|uniref:transcription factor RFX4-like n=1 Tax=Ruditapes philippinarum TaxID=129788 RepID=UPI00295BE8A5|nr:transcription factor RFX4-like [Ruditapes philippinarum]
MYRLEENYEIAEGVCIPRSTLYVHYLDYCEKHDTQPVNAASFGKIIRQQFPQLTTRRLGTRGQSKYHYYGIGVRETSKYYEVGFSAKGVQSSADGKKDTTKQIIAYSPRSKLGTLLPDFPDIKDIKLPPNVAEDKVLTFLMMYRTHCQRILDTVIRANFDEVQSFLLHFWQGMPTHIKSILESKILVTLVGVCDSILYRAIANVLMPTVLQPLPESLTQVIRNFSVQLDDWLRQALDSLPDSLQRVKFDLARRFSQVLKRQTSLNHLCQAARTVINSAEITSQMLDDWFNVDLNSIIKQTLYTTESSNSIDNIVIVKLARDFEILLEEQAPLESYIEWLDGMIEQCVSKKCRQKGEATPRVARQFLLMWSCVGTRVIRDMTLHSAPSFGSFHLLHLMFDEYVLYMVEDIHNHDKANDLLRAVKGEISMDILDDLLISPQQSCKSSVLGDVMDTQRTTVIRGPESPYANTDMEESPAYYSQNDTMCFQQPVMCTNQRLLSPPGPPLNQSLPFGNAYSSPCRQRGNSYYGLYSSHLPEVIPTNNSAANSYDCSDWSTVGQLGSHGSTNMAAGSKSLTDSVVAMKQSNTMDIQTVQLQTEPRINTSQYYSGFCTEQTGVKRCLTGNQTYNRRCLEDESIRPNMADMYYHHVTNLL